MKTRKHIYIVVFQLFLILIMLHTADGQDQPVATQKSESEVETLRRQVEEQRQQILQLKVNLLRQSEQQESQKHQLEAIQQRLEQLASSGGIPDTTRQTTPPGPEATTGTTAKTEQTQKDIAKPETVAPHTADIQPHGVEVGIGKIKFNGLLQAWYLTGNGGFIDTARIRRAELKFTGEISPHFKWTVMIDPSKGLSLNNTFTTINGTQVVRDTSVNQASRILQDAFISLSYFKHMNINVGQFKIPLSLEGLQSSGTLDTERALFASDRARGGTFGDIRDVGLMIYGPLHKRIDYQLGVFNGSGESQNDVDKNDQKVLAGRLVARPALIQGLQIGASGVWGNGQRADRPRRDRFGAESLYVHGPISLKGEFMAGADGAIHRRGYYGHAAYQFNKKFQAIFRVDTWDPDISKETTAASVLERDYVAGFNYFIRERYFKLQFNYLRKTFPGGILSPRNVALLNLQTWW